MNRPLPVHPILVAAFPVLFLWAQNAGEVFSGDALPVLGVTVAGGAALFALLWLALRHGQRAALITSGLLLLFFSYGHVRDVLEEVTGGAAALGAVWAAVAVAVVLAGLRSDGSLPELTRWLNLAAVVLVALSLPGVVDAATGGPALPAPETTGPATAGRRSGPARDIYYIVPDRYGRADTLREQFGFDNTPFLSFLEERGFQVADRSLANYPKTAHSLAASLNMTYLDHLAQQAGPASDDWRHVHALMDDHRVGRFLTEAGYRYVHVGSWFGPTSTSARADVTYRYDTSSEFTTVLARTTLLTAVGSTLGLGEEEARSFFRNNTLFQLDRLERLAAHRDGVPTFVFAHLTIPHEPYVFGPDGSFPSEEEVSGRSREDNYARQLRYLNGRLRRLVEYLLAGPDEDDPIIVIQADEGPHPKRYWPIQDHYVWPEASEAELRRKLGILNAYYLPGTDVEVAESITPVNSFRTIFDAYFGTRLGRLPDRAVVFHSNQRLYDFTDVTARLRP